MKKSFFRKVIPHLIAISIFLIISVLFCKPALEGNVLNQSDISGWKGMAQNSFEYKDKHGHFPLWNPNLFSGMPNYQIALDGKSVLPDINKIFTLGLPKPINFFFLACISFYILCLVLGANTVIAISGSLAFAFSTYNPIIISVGHETKMFAIAYMPALMAGMLLIYEKKYWIGLALTTIATYIEVAVNHPQINFYFFLVALAVTIAYVIAWIRKKEWKHLIIATGTTAIAAIVGVAGSAMSLMTNSEYVKATMRGGKDISIEDGKVSTAKTTGLDPDYALRWSISKPEATVLLMPKAFGESSGKTLNDDSHVVEKLTAKGVPEAQAMQVASSLPKYWGGMSDPSETTAGPPYAGVIICILALIGFVIIKKPIRWALLAVTVLAILMAWGKYFEGFNIFLFDHLPLLNKFRAPSMTLVIAEFTLPFIAVLCLQQILYADNSKELLRADFKKILYTVGGLFGLLILMYLMMDYNSAIDKQIISGYTDKNGSDEFGRIIVAGMKEDRRSMFGGQLLRTLAFAVFVIGMLYLFMKNKMKPFAVAIALGLVSIIDLLVVDKEYLNADSFVPADEITAQHFTPTPIDQQILQDKDPDFRVFDLASGNPYTESRTSYFFKSIGGYHPAKLRIYQDIIDKYLSGPFNQNVLNMLNTKYMITSNQQNNQPQLAPNPDAYGPCWLVKNVKVVNGLVDEMDALGTTDLKDTALVESNFSKFVIQPQWDSTGSIKLEHFDNDTMIYSFAGNKPQFAVFSEVYYPFGWNVYLDGKKTDYCKVNYILRGMSIPAGNHEIKFIFEPESYKKGLKIGYIASYLILIFFIGGLYMQWRKSKGTPVNNEL
ncbi:MAG: YfhO family protein [Bacteroidetes bacterium]|nr:YfhO family protein [Bacteroidota bacterium]MBS1931498.1 YfhO family protein [Bacteroidota bacterium]